MSQFILTLDSSQIYEAQTCPLKWYYRYKENLQLAGMKKPAADKGTLGHFLAEHYYTYIWNRPNESSVNALNYATNEFKRLETTKTLFPEDNGDLESFLLNRFHLYTERYSTNDFILPQSKESPVEVGFSKLLFEDEDYKFIVEGRIDLITLINGNTFCWVDHKFQERQSELYSFKPQFKTYAWATGYEYGLVNYIGLQEDKNNALLKAGKLFRRNLIHFPKEMITEWEGKMLELFFSLSNLIQQPEIAESSCYSMRNDSACAGAFDSNPCQFTHLCEEFNWEMKQRIKEFKYNKVEAWSPWKLNT